MPIVLSLALWFGHVDAIVGWAMAVIMELWIVFKVRTESVVFWALLLVPLGYIARAFIEGCRARRLLKYGVETRCKFRRSVRGARKFHLKGKRDQNMEFVFTDAHGEQRTFVVREEHDELRDDDTEAMVYDPGDPKRATTLDHLPGSPEIVDGKLVARSGLGLIAAAVLACGFAVGLVFILC